ncbi:MAG TPA: ATP-binding cassette domain-containing protein [Solirubrobacteraceae bacterium]|nr:ATP-binding cassette domain-containing protein [Solirubrobacteraceae bacterium]
MILRLEEVSKRYPRPGGRCKVALDGISLEVDRGQIAGVFGPSGAGKTTLLRIAAGLQRPDGGVVVYDGERLDRMSASERLRFRRREVACVWSGRPVQERLGVLDHVALPLLVDGRDHRSAERLASEALLACEVRHCAGMELHELSAGEHQRVAIARAIVTEPRLLLADCPVSSLSFIEQEEIVSLLADLAHEARTAVLITDRNAETLIRADPIFYLCDGRLVNPAPMSERGRVYRFPSASSRRASADA